MTQDHSQSDRPIRVQPPSVLRIAMIVVLVIMAVLALLWIIYKLTPVLLMVVLAIFFAYLVWPLVDLVQAPLRVRGKEYVIPRGIAIGIVYVTLFLAFGLSIYFLAPQLAAQYPEAKLQALSYYKTISNKAQNLNEYFKQHQLPANFADALNNTALGALKSGGGVVEFAAGKLIGLLGYLPWLVLVPILSFFLLKDADTFRRSFLQMVPRGRWRWRADEFFQDVNSALAAYVRAQLTACLLVAIVSTIGFALFGLPSPLVLGMIAGACEFVPLVGPLMVATLVIVMALLHSGFGLAVLMVVFLGVLRIVQDYVIYPRIIGHGIHLHPLAVILSILCGAELAGVAGIFLAIPVIAILTVIYRNWLEHRGIESIAEVLEEAASEGSSVTVEEATIVIEHPTTTTTADEMARARPDLLTGELKIPKLD